LKSISKKNIFLKNKNAFSFYRDNPIGMQGNIALRYGQLVAKLWGNVRGPLAPFELRVRLNILLYFLSFLLI
jgi:hypothetical protein